MRAGRNSVVFLSLLAAGCTALTSIDREDDVVDGVVYHLPKTILTISVFEYHDPDTSRTFYQLGGIEIPSTPAGEKIPTAATVKITGEQVPDLKHRYVIKYRPSAFSDDRLCISRTTSGLLWDVQFASDDRTPEIAFNVARFIAGSISATPDPKSPQRAGFFQRDPAKDTAFRVRSYSAKIDPFEPDDVKAFNAALKRVFRNEGLELDFERAKGLISASRSTWPAGCTAGSCPIETWQERCDPKHICYRTTASLPLQLKLGKEVIDINYADVVNAWDIGTISVTRAFLVHKISKFRFDRGALVAAIIRKPSEVEEMSLLPLHIVNAALITPSGLWAAAFNSSNADKAAMQKQITDLTSAVAGLEAKAAIYGAMAQGGPVFPTGANPGDVPYTVDCSGLSRGTAINFITPLAGTVP